MDRKIWEENQDSAIRQIVSENPTLKWCQVAKRLNELMDGPGRSGKQCRERWYNHLSPNLRKGGWSIEEDKFMVDKLAVSGSKWSQIAKQLTGRSDNSVKNHFYSTVRRTLRMINKELQKKQARAMGLRPLKLKFINKFVGCQPSESASELEDLGKGLREELFGLGIGRIWGQVNEEQFKTRAWQFFRRSSQFSFKLGSAGRGRGRRKVKQEATKEKSKENEVKVEDQPPREQGETRRLLKKTSFGIGVDRLGPKFTPEALIAAIQEQQSQAFYFGGMGEDRVISFCNQLVQMPSSYSMMSVMNSPSQVSYVEPGLMYSLLPCPLLDQDHSQ